MTEPEKFLTRWSRRKRQGADDDVDMSATPSMSETSAPPNESAPVVEKDSGEPGVDLASLPPIESITAQTDIRAFLAPGVPRELAAAALRRAWSVDPAIRDFVGLAAYAWDSHAPGSPRHSRRARRNREWRDRPTRPSAMQPPPVRAAPRAPKTLGCRFAP